MLAAGWLATPPSVEKKTRPGESVTRRVDRGPVHHAPACTRRPPPPATVAKPRRGCPLRRLLRSQSEARGQWVRGPVGQWARGQRLEARGQWASEQC